MSFVSFEGLLETLGRILEPRRPHTWHFLTRMGTKVPPVHEHGHGSTRVDYGEEPRRPHTRHFLTIMGTKVLPAAFAGT